MICPQCGVDNHHSVQTCIRCATPLGGHGYDVGPGARSGPSDHRGWGAFLSSLFPFLFRRRRGSGDRRAFTGGEER